MDDERICRTAVVGTGEVPGLENAPRAAAPEELSLPEAGLGLLVCAPSDPEEARRVLAGLGDAPRLSRPLRVSFPPDGMDLPGVTLRSEWLLSELVGLVARGGPMTAPCGQWSGLLTRATEGMLLPLFVHNVNNLMVGAMGNLDLATMFAGDSEKCRAKLEESSQAMHRLSDFMSDLGGVSRSLPDEGEPAGWDDLKTVCTLGRLACGRSVSLEVSPATLPSGRRMCGGRCLDARTLRVVCSSLMAAALLSLGGCGSIGVSADIRTPAIRFSWARGRSESNRSAPSGKVVPCLAAAMICLPPDTGALRFSSCTPEGGEALLLPGPQSS